MAPRHARRAPNLGLDESGLTESAGVCASVAVVFGMGFGELVVLVIVAIVVIGPKDLPKVLRKLGQWSGKIRRMAGDLRAQSGIDDVLRAEGLGQDIAEIRKLARGELDAVSRDMRLDEGGAGGKNAGASDASGYSDPTLDDRYVAEEREHPQVGPDGFDAMPDTSFVYGASFPKSKYDRDPIYRTGTPDGEIPEDPPDHIDPPDGPPDGDESAHVEGEGEHASAESAASDADADADASETTTSITTDASATTAQAPEAKASEASPDSPDSPEKTPEALP